MKFSEYMRDTLELMADTDWSRYSELQDVTGGALKAAATALWLSGEQQPNAEAMITVLKNRYSYFSDDDALANGEDHGQRFMDQADTFRLTHGLMERLKKEVGRAMIRYYEEKGWTVIDLSRSLPEPIWVEPDEYGTYVFTDGSL